MEYQVIQISFTELKVRLQIEEEDTEKETITQEVRKKLQDVFESYSCNIPKISISFEKARAHPISQKLVRIQRDFEI